jgi:hypothetical protein
MLNKYGIEIVTAYGCCPLRTHNGLMEASAQEKVINALKEK